MSEQHLRDFLKLGVSIWDSWVEIFECFLKWHPRGDLKNRDLQVEILERKMKLLTVIIKFWNLGFKKEIWIYLLSIYPCHPDGFQRFQEDLRVDAIIDMVSRVVMGPGFTAGPRKSQYIIYLLQNPKQVRALTAGTKFPEKFEMFHS